MTFRLPADLMADLERVAAGTDPAGRTGVASLAEVPDAALLAAARWGRIANDPRRRPADVRRARVVKEAYEMIWDETRTRNAV